MHVHVAPAPRLTAAERLVPPPGGPGPSMGLTVAYGMIIASHYGAARVIATTGIAGYVRSRDDSDRQTQGQYPHDLGDSYDAENRFRTG